MRYVVPRMWPDETVAVMATGPSMSQAAADAVREAGVHAMVVNDAWRLAPWADILYAADTRWWEHNQEALAFEGVKLCAQPNCPYPDVHLMRHSGTEGFDADPRYVRTGGNSGYQAVHVAIHTGAARILLLGFDMHGTHFFGPHQTPLRNTSPESFMKWADRFGALKHRGAEIINCTPGSAITAFPFAEIEDALGVVA